MHRLAKHTASLLIVIATLLVSVGASAAPFTVNVATGGAGLPVARFKVVLWGGYAAGMSVQVGSGSASATAPLPAGTDLAVLAFGGDTGKVTRIGNDLVVDMQLNSLLTSSTNLCAPAPNPPASKQYIITITGGGVVTQYGLAGYSATSEVACTCANRRKATGVAWEAGSVPTGTARRIPFNVTTVLDESGSMKSTPKGAAGPSKWTLTTQGVGEFIDAFSAEADSPDQLGLVFFDHRVSPFLNGASRWFPKASFGAVYTQVSSTTHPRSGSTSIGGGLKSALEASICSRATDPIADPMILLMSDGMQNSSPLVKDGAGEDLTYKKLNYSSDCTGGVLATASEQRLTYGCVPVLSVYVDLPPGTPAASLMQAISDQTAGSNAVSAPLTSSPPPAFGTTLIGMLKGSTLSLLAKASGTIDSSSMNSDALSFDVDGTAKRVIVVLGWQPTKGLENVLTLANANDEGEGGEGGNNNMTARRTAGASPSVRTTAARKLKLKLKLPAKANLTKAIRGEPSLRQTPFYVVLAADLPASTTTTNLRLMARRSHDPDGAGTPVPYHLFAYAVESQLEFVPRFTPGRHGTGQPLVLNLDLGLNHAPVTGAGSSVRVSVDGPTGAIGTLLHDLKDPGGQATPGETESAADKKINNLNKNADVIDKTLPKSTGEALSFKELGRGRYQVELKSTQIPGAYVFHVGVDVNGPAGRIQRIEDVETQVEVLPNATTVAVTNVGGGSYDVKVVPLDEFKNYLGPGFESQVQLTLPKGSGQVASVSDTGVDGSYTIHVTSVPAGIDPPAEVLVSGFSVAKGPLSQLGSLPNGGGGGAGGSGGSLNGGAGGGGNGGVGGGVPGPVISCCGATGRQAMGPTVPALAVLLGVSSFGLRRRRSRRDT
jgi:hypothetical protein